VPFGRRSGPGPAPSCCPSAVLPGESSGSAGRRGRRDPLSWRESIPFLFSGANWSHLNRGARQERTRKVTKKDDRRDSTRRPVYRAELAAGPTRMGRSRTTTVRADHLDCPHPRFRACGWRVARRVPPDRAQHLSISASQHLSRKTFASHGCPQEEDLQGQESQPAGQRMGAPYAGPQRLPPVPQRQAAARGMSDVRVVQGPPGPRRWLTPPNVRSPRTLQRGVERLPRTARRTPTR
jgi:hypothetical protein